MKTSLKLLDKAIIVDSKDNVATAREKIDSGTILINDIQDDIVAKEDIPFGFKIALKQIATGEPIIKYGYKIGIATRDIAVGELVHVHNVTGERGRSS